jgi:hypothetical protein
MLARTFLASSRLASRPAQSSVRLFASTPDDAKHAKVTKKDWEGKGHSDEKGFFNKQDEVLMKSLLKKMENQAAGEEAQKVTDCEKMERLFRKWGIPASESLREDLLAWKHE